jgi:HlyD family secretion protein
VLSVQRESEGPVQAGQPVLEVGDPAALEVIVDLLTADAARVEPGAPATIERWGGDGALRAHVRRVEPSAFTKLSALGVEEQRVNVLLDLDDPPERRPSLGDGFRVEASILVWQSDDAVAVPASALFRHGGDWAVFLVEDGRAHLRPVAMGQRTDAEAQILDGIVPGDTVVTYPGEKVLDGVKIEKRTED